MDHFQEKGWNKTEFQFFFGEKKTHRIDFGTNMWWTTDEPYHLEDWVALQFFAGLWQQGRRLLGHSDVRWSVRADISRPQ